MTALNFGAVITELKTSDRSGNMENVVAAFSDIMDYERQQGPYLNAVVAPVAGRIAYGRELVGETRPSQRFMAAIRWRTPFISFQSITAVIICMVVRVVYPDSCFMLKRRNRHCIFIWNAVMTWTDFHRVPTAMIYGIGSVETI